MTRALQGDLFDPPARIYVDDCEPWGEITGYHGEHAEQAARVGARHGHRWCHLFADEASPDALHVFARKLGLQRTWFDRDHYDLVPSKRELAIERGAIPVSTEKAAEIWRKYRPVRRAS